MLNVSLQHASPSLYSTLQWRDKVCIDCAEHQLRMPREHDRSQSRLWPPFWHIPYLPKMLFLCSRMQCYKQTAPARHAWQAPFHTPTPSNQNPGTKFWSRGQVNTCMECTFGSFLPNGYPSLLLNPSEVQGPTNLIPSVRHRPEPACFLCLTVTSYTSLIGFVWDNENSQVLDIKQGIVAHHWHTWALHAVTCMQYDKLYCYTW